MVIVNLQKTPLDDYAHLIIHARIQTVMQKLMEKLNMPIPNFKLDRWAEVELVDNELKVNGIDLDGGPYTLFTDMTAKYEKEAINQKIVMKFLGHYNENSLTVHLPTKLI